MAEIEPVGGPAGAPVETAPVEATRRCGHRRAGGVHAAGGPSDRASSGGASPCSPSR